VVSTRLDQDDLATLIEAALGVIDTRRANIEDFDLDTSPQDSFQKVVGSGFLVPSSAQQEVTPIARNPSPPIVIASSSIARYPQDPRSAAA
jgi:hypothetical protein